VTAAGCLIAAGSLVLLTRITPSGTLFGSVIGPIMIFGAGLAVFYIPMTVAAVYRVPPGRTGVASALVNVTRTVGGAIGLAIISAVVTSRISHQSGRRPPGRRRAQRRLPPRIRDHRSPTRRRRGPRRGHLRQRRPRRKDRPRRGHPRRH